MHWIVGWIEWQLIDHHQRERLTLHVHTLPEALEAEEHRARTAAKLLKQRNAVEIAPLHQHGIAIVAQLFVDARQYAFERAEAAEEQERPPLRRLDQRRQLAGKLIQIRATSRAKGWLLAQSWHVEQRMSPVVEGMRQHD